MAFANGPLQKIDNHDLGNIAHIRKSSRPIMTGLRDSCIATGPGAYCGTESTGYRNRIGGG